jgi:MFS family permease
MNKNGCIFTEDNRMGDGGSALNKRIKAGIGKTFPALLHKNFRYFWVGQCISLIGSWMQTAGQAWLVLQITNNAFLLGLLNAVQTLPMLVFSVFAGTIVDRFPKRKVTIITQTCLMACAFILSLLIFLNQAKYGYILIIAAVLGFVQSIDMPARQSMMVELVGREDLLNAIALNSSIFNAARVLGPVAAGLVMGWLGPGAAFFINGVSFIAVIYGLFKIKIEDKPNLELSGKSILKNTMEGIRYIFTRRILYVTFILVAVLWMFSINLNTFICLKAYIFFFSKVIFS